MIFDNILNGEIPWPEDPEDMSPEARDLIEKLLNPDPAQRLGAQGAWELKSPPLLRGHSVGDAGGRGGEGCVAAGGEAGCMWLRGK